MDNVIDTIYIPFSLHEWEKDKWDKYILEEERKQELREKKKMFDRVRRMGLRDGRTENMIEIIKSMLKNNLSYDVISKVTNKTIDEIKDIEKNI